MSKYATLFQLFTTFNFVIDVDGAYMEYMLKQTNLAADRTTYGQPFATTIDGLVEHMLKYENKVLIAVINFRTVPVLNT